MTNPVPLGSSGLCVSCGLLTELNAVGTELPGDGYPTHIVQFCAGASRNRLALLQPGPNLKWLFMAAPEPLDFAPCEHMICDCRAFNMGYIDYYKPDVWMRLERWWDCCADPISKEPALMEPYYKDLGWYNMALKAVAPNRGPAHWQRLSPKPTAIDLTTLDKLLAIVRRMGGAKNEGREFTAQANLVHFGRVLTLWGDLWQDTPNGSAHCGSWLLAMALQGLIPPF